MHPIYCPKCHVMLMKAKLFNGEVKCHKCKELVTLNFISATGYNELLTRSEKAVTIVT